MDLRRTLPPIAIATALLVGCSSEAASPHRGGAPGVTTTVPAQPRIDLDPERYVLDYESTQVDSNTTGAAPSTTGAAPGTGAAGTTADSGGDVAPLPPVEPPSIYDDNTFVDPGESPFRSTREEPTSTFGLDVDTGSLSIGRTFLAAGTRPPTDSVRTEEWVNALGSDQEGPSTTDLGVSVSGSDAPFRDDGTKLVRVGVAARDLSSEDRPAAHLTFVVDTSGSMDIRERLGLVKASLGLLVLSLRDDDTIAIVQYSDEAGVVLEPTRVADAERIVDAIDELQPSNSTNLEAGLRAGYRQAQDAFEADGINAVVLASDGVANVGLTDPDGLAGVIQDRAQDGIHLVTVGYGMGNYDDDLMEQVADQGDGFYAYLDTYEQAERLFRDRLTSTLAVVAGDAKAQVTFDDSLVSSYRLVGYENRALATEDFDDDTVDAGEVGAGHRVTALYEVVLADTAVEPSADDPLGTAEVRYRSAASGDVVTVDAPITYGDVDRPFAEAPADLRLQAATAAFAEWLAVDGPVDGPDGEATLPIGEIRAAAQAAADDLPATGLPGSVVTPDEVVELMVQAETAPPAPGPQVIVD